MKITQILSALLFGIATLLLGFCIFAVLKIYDGFGVALNFQGATEVGSYFALMVVSGLVIRDIVKENLPFWGFSLGLGITLTTTGFHFLNPQTPHGDLLWFIQIVGAVSAIGWYVWDRRSR